MIVLKQILVATDFGTPASTALAYGRALARTFGAKLHVVHVVDDVSSRMMAVDGVPEYLGLLTGAQQQIEVAARKDLEGLLTDDDRQVLGARGIVLTSSTPSEAILAYARQAFVDLIITGTNGRGVMGHLLLGSVAERLVRSAPCPVLTVRHPEHDFLRPDALQVTSRA